MRPLLPALLALALPAPALAAAPYAGLEWRPLSRGDLAWVLEGDSTGLLVGPDDGFVRPQLAPYAGAWVTQHVGLHASLGVARLTTTSWAGDVYVQHHWGVIRPAFDVRVALLRRDDPRPSPWLFAGAHLDAPSSRATSNGYTQEERDAAREAAALDRVRLGGVGGRIGAGVDVQLLPAVRLGGQWALGWQRTLFRGADPTAITQWLAAEGSLLLEVHWPQKPAPPDEAAPAE
ncbi:MAG: hypothetical protein R3F59_32530 [Myxococcota bacterium]